MLLHSALLSILFPRLFFHLKISRIQTRIISRSGNKLKENKEKVFHKMICVFVFISKSWFLLRLSETIYGCIFYIIKMLTSFSIKCFSCKDLMLKETSCIRKINEDHQRKLHHTCNLKNWLDYRKIKNWLSRTLRTI